jgi:glycosyltransferase involved in cell wall biosynthesis
MAKKFNILVLDFTLRGGIERYVANMAEIFNAHEHKVVIYSLHKSLKAPLYAVPENVEVSYVTNIKMRRFFYKFSTVLACHRLLKNMKNLRSDTIIMSTSPIITIIMFFMNRSLLKNLIATEHSTYLAHGKVVRALRIFVYKHVLKVVAQTKDGVDNFKAQGVPCYKIPNPATDFKDLRQWKRRDSVARGDMQFNCLSIGRFEPVKQLDHFIQTARIVSESHPNISFTLIGSGSQEAYLRKKIIDADVSHVFRMIPPTTKVNDYYALADLYVITSSSEAFPMTALEALSFGVPVVSYNGLVGPSEIVKTKFNGFLVAQNDPTAMAKKVIEIYEEKQFFENMRSNALISSRPYSPVEIYKQWLEII